MRLPPFARQSREILQRFATNPPPQTTLELGTMGLLTRPRHTEVTVKDLQLTKRRFGLINYCRDTPVTAQRKWYQFRPVTKFNIQSPDRGAKDSWVWDVIAAAITRRNSK
jgi:hypothetical protein